MRKMLPLFALLGGCSVNEDSWPNKYAHATCDFAKRCSSAYFFYEYDNVNDCVDEYKDYWEEYGASRYADCNFDQGKAKDCLNSLDRSCKAAGSDYDDLFDDCYDVWDCGDGYSAD